MRLAKIEYSDGVPLIQAQSAANATRIQQVAQGLLTTKLFNAGTPNSVSTRNGDQQQQFATGNTTNNTSRMRNATTSVSYRPKTRQNKAGGTTMQLPQDSFRTFKLKSVYDNSRRQQRIASSHLKSDPNIFEQFQSDYPRQIIQLSNNTQKNQKIIRAGRKTVDNSRSGIVSYAETSSNYNNHLLNQEYETSGIQMYQELKKLKGTAETAKELVDCSEGFVYGGWTRQAYQDSRLEGEGMGIGQIIPQQVMFDSIISTQRKGRNRSDLVNNANRTNCDFSGFATKGKPIDLAAGIDNYTQSFHLAFSKDRDQAKRYMMTQMSMQKRRNSQGAQGSISVTAASKASYQNRAGAPDHHQLFNQSTTASAIRTQRKRSHMNTNTQPEAAGADGASFVAEESDHQKSGDDEMLIEVSPQQFQDAYESQMQRNFEIKNQRLATVPNSLMNQEQILGQEADCDDEEKKEIERSTKYKHMKREVDKRQKDQNNPLLQVRQLHKQFSKEQQKRDEAKYGRLKTKAIYKARKLKLQNQDEDKKVRIREDSKQIEKQLIKRLSMESKIMEKDQKQRSLLARVTPFFDKEIYENAKKMMEHDEQGSLGSYSAGSFKSGELFSENNNDSADGASGPALDKVIGDGSDGGSDDSDDDGVDKQKNLDYFMKDIEKRLVQGQGLKGFTKLKKEASAKGEDDRECVLSKMFLQKINYENDEEIKHIANQEFEALSSDSEDEKQESDVQEHTRHAMGMVQYQLAEMGLVKPEFDAAIEVEGGHTKTIGQRRFSKVINGQIVGHKFGLADPRGAGAFYEEYKAEKIPGGNRREGSDYSDASDLEKELAGISALHKKTVSARNAKEKKPSGAIFGKAQEAKLTSEQNTCEMQAYADKKQEKVLKSFNQVIKTVKFQQINKKMHAGEQTGLDQKPEYVYLQECDLSNELILPIVSKIHDRVLFLENYRIQKGQFKGICEAITQTGQPILQDVSIDNCQVDDEMFANLVIALTLQHKLGSLTFKRGIVSEKSLAALSGLLIQQPPTNLLELRLVNCTTTPSILQAILRTFAHMEQSHLRSLALIQMKINFPLDDLALFVQKSEQLQDLDISGNDCQPVHFKKLLPALAHNRVLHTLNLSWNSIIDRWDQIESDSLVPYSTESYNNLTNNGLLHNYVNLESFDHIKKTEMPALLIDCINHLIRFNSNIQCINLDNTGLNSRILTGLLPGLRHAKSLLCFHVAQNPGITKKVKNFYRERLSIQDKVKQLVIDVKRDRDDLMQPLGRKERVVMSDNEIKIRHYKVANYRKWLMEEAASIQHQRIESQRLNLQEIRMVSAYNKDLTISRILGHKKNQPGKGQWLMNTKLDNASCWFCHNWMYTLIFWNQDIGILNANNNINIESEEKARIIGMIRNNDPDYKGNPEVPMLFSNATNWRGRPFVRLYDFVMKNTSVPNFTHQATQMAKERLGFTDFDTLPEEGRKEVYDFIENKIVELKQEFTVKATEDFLEMKDPRKYIRYGHPLFINKEKVVDPENTFILPMFIKPGRTHFILRTPQNANIKARADKGARVRILDYQTRADVHFRFYYNRHIVPSRQEKVPGFGKLLRVADRDFRFKREESNFKTWRQDTPESVEKALDNDFGLWKVHKFVKDSKDLLNVKNFFREHFLALMEVRVGIIASSSSTQMSARDFRKLCAVAGLTGKTTQAQLDGTFAAANYDEADNDFNDNKALVRYEFLEILVRIANLRYVQNGSLPQNANARALHRLVNEHILPILQETRLPQWQPFRENYLWTDEVDGLIEANLVSLRSLFGQILALENVKRRYCIDRVTSRAMISIDQVLHFLKVNDICQKPEIRRNKKAKYLADSFYFRDGAICSSFYLSKMTVADEHRDGPLQYSHLQFVEYLEFVGRLAYLYFEATPQHVEWRLEDKMEVMLGHLFKPGKYKFQQSKQDVHWLESDSDDDY